MQINFQETNTPFRKNVLFQVKKAYEEAVTEKTSTNHTIDVPIPRDGIMSFNRDMKPEFDITLGSGRERFKQFPRALSMKDLWHYVDSTLEEWNFKAKRIHIGINDITVYDSTSRKINLLLQNIKEIGQKCHSYKVKYVFISKIF